jgi:hypothetical protein
VSRRRLVLLGASNLLRGFRPVLRAVHAAWDAPVDVLAALGHGRSYGYRSRFFFRDLPPILECGLWHALEQRPPEPTRALVTDVGNDIAYGAPPERILGWAEECVRRLRALDAEVVIAGLPIDRLERLSAAGYTAVRSVFFPFHRWRSREEALGHAREVTEGLGAVAARHGATFVPLPLSWYGIDPIHIRPRARALAWSALLFALEDGTAPAPAARKVQVPSAPRLYLLRPEREWLFGAERWHRQPALTLRGGSSLSLY